MLLNALIYLASTFLTTQLVLVHLWERRASTVLLQALTCGLYKFMKTARVFLALPHSLVTVPPMLNNMLTTSPMLICLQERCSSTRTLVICRYYIAKKLWPALRLSCHWMCLNTRRSATLTKCLGPMGLIGYKGTDWYCRMQKQCHPYELFVSLCQALNSGSRNIMLSRLFCGSTIAGHGYKHLRNKPAPNSVTLTGLLYLLPFTPHSIYPATMSSCLGCGTCISQRSVFIQVTLYQDLDGDDEPIWWFLFWHQRITIQCILTQFIECCHTVSWPETSTHWKGWCDHWWLSIWKPRPWRANSSAGDHTWQY